MVAPNPGPSEESAQRPSLVGVAAVGSLVSIGLCVLGWWWHDLPDEESRRFLMLAFGGPAITGFVGTGFAYVRGYRPRELGWLIPATWLVATLAAAPLAFATEPSAGSVSMAALGAAIALATGGLAFGFVGVPVTILLRAAFARSKPAASAAWWSVAALLFAASMPAVVMAIDPGDSPSSRGHGVLIWLRIFGVPIGEVRSDATLWVARGLLALAAGITYVGHRAHKRENPRPVRRQSGQGRRPRRNRYRAPQ